MYLFSDQVFKLNHEDSNKWLVRTCGGGGGGRSCSDRVGFWFWAFLCWQVHWTTTAAAALGLTRSLHWLLWALLHWCCCHCDVWAAGRWIWCYWFSGSAGSSPRLQLGVLHRRTEIKWQKLKLLFSGSNKKHFHIWSAHTSNLNKNFFLYQCLLSFVDFSLKVLRFVMICVAVGGADATKERRWKLETFGFLLLHRCRLLLPHHLAVGLWSQHRNTCVKGLVQVE